MCVVFCVGYVLCAIVAHLQGFHLQDPEVDDVVRAARDLEAGCIEPDAQFSGGRECGSAAPTTRLLQLGLEVQYAEADTLLAENNGLRDDVRVRAANKLHL